MSKSINISGRQIGENNPAFIIAELSANHGGDYKKAKELICAANEAGADCVKIQLSKPEMLTLNSKKEYFKINKGNWKGKTLYSLYEETYTPWEWVKPLKKEAEKLGLIFFGSVFGKEAVDFMEELDIGFYKVASFEMSDIPLIEYIASKDKPIIMSTGTSTLGEIENAVNSVRKKGNDDIILLKCTSTYPAKLKNMNLRTIPNMKETFKTPVGLSDHSLGGLSAVAAVTLGASVIEKHICLSRDIDTPDSSFSMEPKEFKKMIYDIRELEEALGEVKYCLSEDEKYSKNFSRSIFVKEDIKRGDRFTKDNIKIIRPGYGLAPKFYNTVLKYSASKDIERGEPLDWSMIE